MPPHIYHILHLVGLIFLFVGIGGMLSPGGNTRTGMKYHGIGLLILFVTGFGMLAVTKRANPDFSYAAPWVIGKFIILVALGALPVLAKKRVLQPGVIVLIAVALGGVAAYLGYLKPA